MEEMNNLLNGIGLPPEIDLTLELEVRIRKRGDMARRNYRLE
jgi:hypothetical protein